MILGIGAILFTTVFSTPTYWELPALSTTGVRNEYTLFREMLVIRITNLGEEDQGKEV